MTIALSPWQQVEEEFKCDHAKEQVVKHIVGSGLIQVKKQCLHCGEFTSNSLKQANYNLANLPYADLEKQAEYRSRKSAAYEAKRTEQLNNLQGEGSDQWWAKYNRYLRSHHWEQLRASVIRRDSFCCQNCFKFVDESSAHVHHVSYTGFNRVGKSFAFECVTLCRDCHIEFHPHMQAEEPQVTDDLEFDIDVDNWWKFRESAV